MILGNGIISQLLVLAVIIMATVLGMLAARRPKDALMRAAIFLMPLQGGYWLSFLKMDFRFSYIIILPLFFMVMTSSSNLKVKEKFYLPLTLTMLLFLTWGTISASRALLKDYAFGHLITFVIDLIIFLTVLNYVKKPEDFRVVLRALFAALLFQAVLGLIQYKARWFRIGVIDAERWQLWRSTGTFLHPNAFGMYLLFVLPLVFRQVIISFHSKNTKRMLRYFFFFLIAGFVLYSSRNRGSWIGFAFGISATVAYDLIRQGRTGRRIRKIVFQVLGVLFVIISLAMVRYGSRIYERMFETNAERNWERREMLQENAYKIIDENPLFGVGMRNYVQYVNTEFVHNMYLMISAEVGIPGLIIFSVMMVIFLWQGFRLMMAKSFYLSNIGSGFLASGLAFLLASVPGPDFFVSHQTRMSFWVIFALAVALNRMYKKQLKVARMKEKLQYQQSRNTSYSNVDLPLRV